MKDLKYLVICLVVLMSFCASTSNAQDSLRINCVKRMYNSSGRPTNVTGENDLLYVVTRYQSSPEVNSPELHILDISDPANVSEISMGFLPLHSSVTPRIVKKQDNYLYVSTDAGLTICNVQDPQNIFFSDNYEVDNGIFGLYIQNRYAYLGRNDGIFEILDISNPVDPEPIGSLDVEMPIKNIEIVGQVAYISGDYFASINVSNPENPVEIDRLDILAYNFEIQGHYAYLAAQEEGLLVIDLSRPDRLQEVGHFRMQAYDLAIRDNLLFATFKIEVVWDPVGEEDVEVANMVTLDINNPQIPRLTDEIPLCSGDYEGFVESYQDIIVYYLNGALQFISAENNPVRIGSYVADVCKPTLSLVGTDLYLVNNASSLKKIDISDPENPFESENFDLGYNGTKRITVLGNYLYLTGGYNDRDFGIYDLNNRRLRGGFYFDHGRIQSMDVADDRILYFAVSNGLESGLSILNAVAPDRPRLLTHFITNSEIYDVKVSGGFAYIAAGIQGLFVIDVSALNNPQIVYQYETPDRARRLCIDGDLLYLDDNNLHILDISNPREPLLVGNFEFPIEATTFTMTVRNDALFITRWEGDLNGIYVLDVSIPSQPRITGYYQTIGAPYSIAASPPYLFSAEGRHVAIYNCSDALGITTDDKTLKPCSFGLTAYPNPFNSNTTISYRLDKNSDISLQVLDLSGRIVATLLEGSIEAGYHLVQWDASGLSSGVYLCRLFNANQTRVEKLVLIR